MTEASDHAAGCATLRAHLRVAIAELKGQFDARSIRPRGSAWNCVVACRYRAIYRSNECGLAY